MQIDKQPFPMNTLGLEGKKVLIRPELAGSANKNNVIVGEPRNSKENDKVLERAIVIGKQPNGKETLKITIKNPTLGGQAQAREGSPTKFIKPKSPEVGRWKINRVEAKRKRIKPTFDMLLSKYTNQLAGSNSNRSSHMKGPRSPPREKSPQHTRPYGPRAPRPWMASPPLRALLLRWRMGAAPNGTICFSSGKGSTKEI